MTQDSIDNVEKYESFKAFYPFYLSQHENTICRTLHFIGSWVVLILLASAIYSGNYWLFIGLPIAGYGFAWVGHFIFEKNKPATFTYPIYSLMGDWVMFWQLLTGKLSFKS